MRGGCFQPPFSCPIALLPMPLYRSALILPLLTTSLFSVTGCQKTDEQAPASASSSLVGPSAVLPASAASAPAASPELIKGIYFWGPEVETISPCNTNQTFWLDGSETVLAPLEEMALDKANRANEAYQPIYAELRVVRKGQATDGFAVEYDGVVELQEVVASNAEVPADCKLIELPTPPAEPASEAASAADAAASQATAVRAFAPASASPRKAG